MVVSYGRGRGKQAICALLNGLPFDPTDIIARIIRHIGQRSIELKLPVGDQVEGSLGKCNQENRLVVFEGQS